MEGDLSDGLVVNNENDVLRVILRSREVLRVDMCESELPLIG
jgi:hypothetical protein